MRKVMTKEITTTTLVVAKMEMVDGKPQAVQLPNETLLGNVSLEKAQKEIVKKHGAGATVFEVNVETKVYELPVEKFLEVATVKVEQIEAELN